MSLPALPGASKTEAADIAYLLRELGHGKGTEIQRAVVKAFRSQAVILGAIEAIREQQARAGQ